MTIRAPQSMPLVFGDVLAALGAGADDVVDIAVSLDKDSLHIKAALRNLEARGLAEAGPGWTWGITDAGRAALAASKSAEDA